ncbi:MAG: DNA modification methylase [Colwellia sp.]|nr:DNA modification methylase [Colwellia sp.]
MIKLVKITEVKPNKDNPRTINDDKFKKLVKSIKEFPKMLEIRPIVVDDDMVVLGGNMRLKACKEAGLGQVHIIKAEHLTEEQKKEFIIKDNVGFGEWDWELLNNEWDTDDLEEWGLDLPEFFEEEEEETVGDDEAPEIPEDPETVLGDLWELGDHRLLCGDSTEITAVDKLMDGQKADMVFTDPPYGIGYSSERFEGVSSQSGLSSKRNNAPMILGDETDFDPSFILAMFPKVKEIFVWGYQYYPDKLGRGGIIVWNKKTETQSDCAHGDFELCWSKSERNKMIWLTWGGFKNKEQGEERLHTTQKPIKLAEDFFKYWAKGLTNVVDLFMGAGYTLIACEKTKRNCLGMELDPKYCDVIVKRYIDFCRKNNRPFTVKLNGEEYKGELLNE